jgi:hypothetical protein
MTNLNFGLLGHDALYSADKYLHFKETGYFDVTASHPIRRYVGMHSRGNHKYSYPMATDGSVLGVRYRGMKLTLAAI